jgi:endoglycosylceramidase
MFLFLRLVNKYIREVDTETLVFFEPYFTDVFGGGFKENVGGKEFEKKEVLSYHVYCGVVDS